MFTRSGAENILAQMELREGIFAEQTPFSGSEVSVRN